jgi:hypothetical protein
MMAKRQLAVLAGVAVLLAGQVFAQATPETPTDNSPDSTSKEWSFSVAASGYLVPNDQSYGSPTLTADHQWLHLEARYNYENQQTGSLWAGYNFSVGQRVTLEVSPCSASSSARRLAWPLATTWHWATEKLNSSARANM